MVTTDAGAVTVVVVVRTAVVVDCPSVVVRTDMGEVIVVVVVSIATSTDLPKVVVIVSAG